MKPIVDSAARAERLLVEASPTHWASVARSLRPLVEAEVYKSEELRTLSPAVVDALKQTRLFWLLTPVEVGGGGCSYRDLIETIEELSYADCSAGWTLMANCEATAAAAAYCGDDAVDAMFGGRDLGIAAGQLGPSGKCRQMPGGYQAGGNFSYGSGCAHASWFGGGMMVMENGKPRMMAHGPEVQCCFVPTEKVIVKDNWHVAGLSATGSFDYEIPEQFISGGYAFERATPVRKRGRLLFDLGFAPIISAGHAAVVLGAMKRALHEAAKIGMEKKRVGYPGVIGEHPTFLLDYGYQEATYMAAREYVIKVYDDGQKAVEAGQPVTDYQKARFRQVASWVHKVAADVVRACYTWSGAEGFRESTPMGRAFRDTFVASNHLFTDPIHMAHAAPALMGYHLNDTGPA